MTTRAIAERAGLPHGTVSYHFQGKHELLTEAALSTIEDLFPMSELEAIQSAQELIHSWLGGQHALDSVGLGVLTEAMREAKQNPALRHRLACSCGSIGASWPKWCVLSNVGAPLCRA